MPDTHAWHETHDNLIALSRHLLDIGELGTGEEVVSFFEKPWKWSGEWLAYQRGLIAAAELPPRGEQE